MRLNIIFFSDIHWDALYQRPQHLASRLAGRHEVLWVEPATLGGKRFFTPVRITGSLHRLTLPFIPYNARNAVLRHIAGILSRFAPFRALLVLLQARLLRRALGILGWVEGRQCWVVQNLQAGALLGGFTPDTVVYDCIDNPFGFVDFPPHVHAEWEFLLRRADSAVATSPNLARLIRGSVDREVRIISNGVETERYAKPPAARPGDIPAEPPAIIGYVGSVYPWLDFSLLTLLCRSMPDVRLVLIGNAHPAVREELHRLSTFPNFTFLGSRPYSAVPSYLHHFAAGIIPFLATPLTAGVNPVKLYEYAAAGAPIVSTRFSDDLGAFGAILHIAGSHEEFLSALRRAIGRRADRKYQATLRAFAAENDWERKTGEFLTLIEGFPVHPNTSWHP